MKLCEKCLYFIICFSHYQSSVSTFSTVKLFQTARWILIEFQQIVVLSSQSWDSSLVQASVQEQDGKFVMATSISTFTTAGAFQNYDEMSKHPPLTAIIISENNETILAQFLHKIIAAINDTKISWNFNTFYFILWPTILNRNACKDVVKDFQASFKRLNLSLPVNSDVFVIAESENSFSLWETYSIKGLEVFQEITANLQTSYLLWELIKLKWKRRNNFLGAPIIATGTNDPIYEAEVNFTIHANGTSELYNGMGVAIYRVFRDYLNFTETSVIGEYIGEKLNNPAVLGMETYLQNGDADIAITGSGLNTDNAIAVNLLHATTANWLEARFSLEPKSKWKFFLSPFDSSIWYLIILHVVVMVTCTTLYRKVLKVPHEPSESFNLWKYLQLDLLWAIATLCMQGWYDLPNKTPVRILFLLASVTGFLLNAAYSGTITSQLSSQNSIGLSIEKLINQSYHFFMENDFSFPVDPEKFSKEIVITKLYSLNDSKAAVTNILKFKSALISWPELFYTAIQNIEFTDADACSMFTTIKVSTVPQLAAMAVKKRSQFKEVFNVKLLYLWERGIIPRIYRDYKKNTQLRCEYDNYSLNPQSLGELFLAFLIITLGIIVSAGLLLIELIVAILTHTMMSEQQRYIKIVH